MILDDPFASVDPKTEGEILAKLREETGDSIVILISHRLGSFPSLDQVVVLSKEEGAMVGSHDKLLSDSPLYRSLNLLQQKGGAGHE